MYKLQKLLILVLAGCLHLTANAQENAIEVTGEDLHVKRQVRICKV